MKHEKTWMDFQSYLLESHADMNKSQQTSLQGGYSSGGEHNVMVIQEAFSNLS